MSLYPTGIVWKYPMVLQLSFACPTSTSKTLSTMMIVHWIFLFLIFCYFGFRSLLGQFSISLIKALLLWDGNLQIYLLCFQEVQHKPSKCVFLVNLKAWSRRWLPTQAVVMRAKARIQPDWEPKYITITSGLVHDRIWCEVDFNGFCVSCVKW